jgi:hypothetical protein
MGFLLISYALSAGNAGTGFRYRTHVVLLAVAVLAALREGVVPALSPRTVVSRPIRRAERPLAAVRSADAAATVTHS